MANHTGALNPGGMSPQNLKDLTGHRFGRWTVLELHPVRSKGSVARWLSRCDCGTERAVRGDALRRGRAQACGCLSLELKAARATHGHARKGRYTPEYWSWLAMKKRCLNPRQPAWKNYGGRGIGIDDPRWLKFENFYADMGNRPPGLSLERRDNSLGYSGANCRWASPTDQARNSRIAKLTVSHAAEIRALAGSVKQAVIAARFGVAPSTVSALLTGRTWKLAA